MIPTIGRPLMTLATAAALAFGAAPLLAAQQPLYRVKCGGDAFFDKAGHYWEADAHYEGGGTYKEDSAISGTDMPWLYQSERFNSPDAGNLKYAFPVPPGEYKVILHFAEIWNGAQEAGKRVFDVQINGTAVAQDLDVFAQAGGYAPLILDFLSMPIDGRITVEFFNKAGHAKIAGIEVIPLAPRRATAPPYRINCAGDDWADADGNVWEGDGHYNSGATFFSKNPVSGTDMPILYQSERWNGNGDLEYAFDAPPGTYTVRLHFAEIFFDSAGQRIFDVDINGTSAITGLDLAADPGPDIAVVKEFNVEPQAGKITIALRNQTQNAKISAIEILPANAVSARPPAGMLKARKPGIGDVNVDANGRLAPTRAKGFRIPAGR